MRYFSTQCPVAPGAFPEPVDSKILVVDNFDTFDGRKLRPAVELETCGYINYEKPLAAEQSVDCGLIPQRLPRYIKAYDGYTDVLAGLNHGESPIYRFPGGERVADRYEAKTGGDARSDLE